MRNEFTAVIERDGEWFIAYCPEVPGANGQGASIEECRQDLAEAMSRRAGAQVVGPVPLPTHIQKLSVIRSPFIDKDSQEQFEIRTHKRLIDIVETTSKTIDALTKLNLPSGVEIDIKI